MVGDSEVDAETAVAGSIAFILMSYGYHRGPLEAIPHLAILASMEDLTEAELGKIALLRPA
jgi:phosphoglycolate phosphatase-like HAD superfamily hydrolase